MKLHFNLSMTSLIYDDKSFPGNFSKELSRKRLLSYGS